MSVNPLSLVVLISGNGSNLQAIIDAIQQQTLPAKIAMVISNCDDAYGLVRAAQANIPTAVLSHKNYSSRAEFDRALQNTIDPCSPDLIVLAGFMRKLGPEIVQHYLGKMINIHPSLLPKHPGLNTHHKALAAADQEHGVSIHFVTEDLDAGPVISQMALAITATETVESLQQRVLQLEHRLYPETLRWFGQNRIQLIAGRVWIDGKPREQPLLLTPP